MTNDPTDQLDDIIVRASQLVGGTKLARAVVVVPGRELDPAELARLRTLADAHGVCLAETEPGVIRLRRGALAPDRRRWFAWSAPMLRPVLGPLARALARSER